MPITTERPYLVAEAAREHIDENTIGVMSKQGPRTPLGAVPALRRCCCCLAPWRFGLGAVAAVEALNALALRTWELIRKAVLTAMFRPRVDPQASSARPTPATWRTWSRWTRWCAR